MAGNKTRLTVAFAGVVLSMLACVSEAFAAPKVETKPDDAWISVSGTIVSAEADSFRLDYGEGIITVEMDDFDSYGDAKPLMRDDQVTVYGFVDDDLFEKRTIEASSVYVEGLGTTFYANGADEEDFGRWTIVTPVDVGNVMLTGSVIGVTGREFTIATGRGVIKVDTDELGYNPLDNRGFQQIDVGDRVQVSGNMDYDIFELREVKAEQITTLQG